MTMSAFVRRIVMLSSHFLLPKHPFIVNNIAHSWEVIHRTIYKIDLYYYGLVATGRIRTQNMQIEERDQLQSYMALVNFMQSL